jgi:hypothetical protein
MIPRGASGIEEDTQEVFSWHIPHATRLGTGRFT